MSKSVLDELVKKIVITCIGGHQRIRAAGKLHPLVTDESAEVITLMVERSCFALGGPTERKMKRGDTGLVELGGAYRRYTSTLGRQWSIGKPSARLIDLHKVVREASEA